jgi:C-terminal processing protease CtpA/Prc
MRRAISSAVAAIAMLAHAAWAQSPQRVYDVERLEQLGRLWVYADYFNPYLGDGRVDWDQALIDIIPTVRRARTDADYVAALNVLLARSGDPAARVTTAERPHSQFTTTSEPVRVEEGVAIADCGAMAQAAARGANPLDFARALAEAPRGGVVDCRTISSDARRVARVLATIIGSRTHTPLSSGAMLVRSYSGLPPEQGTSTGGYFSGASLIRQASIQPAARTLGGGPLAFLVDETADFVLPQLAALQAAGHARVVAAGNAAELAVQDFGDMRVQMSRSIYIYPDGAVGFRPDATAPADDRIAGLRVAIDQLTMPSVSTTPARTLAPRAPTQLHSSDGVPPVETRLLALFRLWGAIEYFYPYKSLMDRPWDEAFAEFIPLFVAADTRERYETAVLRLMARTQDSHSVLVRGLTATLYGTSPSTPGLQLRYVEERPVVIEVRDAALAGRIAVGDEILAVDGVPIARVEQRLAPLLAASTPQAQRNDLARRILSGPSNSVATLRVRGADGRVRTERAPRSNARPPEPTDPAWRMLEGGIGYIDLERLTRADADRALDELIEARALILDLRGYPQGTAWLLAPRLANREGPIVGAQFRRALYAGPPSGDTAAMSATFEQTLPHREGARYAGPVFVLIDERAISQAEHMALFLEAAADVTFVGEPTNGTNGDITNVSLPGGLTIHFTGHDVRHADGRQLQRVGIQPHVPAAPTIAGLRAGRDEVLEAALELARR